MDKDVIRGLMCVGPVWSRVLFYVIEHTWSQYDSATDTVAEWFELNVAECARQVGVTRQGVHAGLARLTADGVIVRDGAKVRICDEQLRDRKQSFTDRKQSFTPEAGKSVNDRGQKRKQSLTAGVNDRGQKRKQSLSPTIINTTQEDTTLKEHAQRKPPITRARARSKDRADLPPPAAPDSESKEESVVPILELTGAVESIDRDAYRDCTEKDKRELQDRLGNVIGELAALGWKQAGACWGKQQKTGKLARYLVAAFESCRDHWPDVDEPFAYVETTYREIMASDGDAKLVADSEARRAEAAQQARSGAGW